MGNVESFRREFGLIIVGAIVFTASFLWKDLLVDIEDYFFPKQYNNMAGRIAFTILVTAILIVIAISLRNVLGLGHSNEQPVVFDDSPIDDNDSQNDFDFDPGLEFDIAASE